MALALAADGRVRLHVFHDERSAAFCALGIGRALGRPAVVVCTSGTAAVEFHPAVVEADHGCVPMIVITADRPPELQGVGAPQTIDQRDLYGRSVRWYCEPGPPARDGWPWWRDLARDGWARTSGVTPGPVHLNLAFREPLVGTPWELPPPDAPAESVRPGASWGLTDEEVARLTATVSGRRGLIVAGTRAARDPAEAAAVLDLADVLGWPVLADPPSGCRDLRRGVVAAFDPLLRHEGFAAHHRPEVVIRLGGLVASSVTNRWLADSGAVQVGFDHAGRCPDPDRVLSRSLPVDVASACRQLAAAGPVAAPEPWRAEWVAAERLAREAIDGVLGRHAEATEPAAAVDLLAALPAGASLVVSSSMPVRDLEWFAPPRPGVRVLANRGANGIDGVVSTAVGVALAGGGPTGLLVGDLAFLHDTNGLLGLPGRGVDLVTVVLDNDGGGIFSFLPQARAVPLERFEQLFGTPHGVDLVAVAEAHGVPAERVATRAGLQAAVAGALTRGGPRVVVVDTDRDANVAVHGELNAAVGQALERAASVIGDG
jgi:2-succinyl-5-enolpyruvyl-6-hydroxy-3-cyclohexene-1-carboxylate synthase